MLTELRVKNYALIRDLVFTPGKGLNVITGETGAGKSILLGALGLILGNRADQAVLLNQEEKCVVEGFFDALPDGLLAWLVSQDIDAAPQLILRREIVPGGRSRSFINDTPASLQQLKEAGNFLVEIQTQHSGLLLADGERQREILDHWAGNKNVLQQCNAAWQALQKQRQELSFLQSEQFRMLQERDFNQFQLAEIDALNPRAGEMAELESEISRLTHAGDIGKAAHEAASMLDDDPDAVVPLLGRVRGLLKPFGDLHPAFTPAMERINQAALDLRELARELGAVAEASEQDPEQLEQLNERQYKLQHLLKKHQLENTDGLIALRERLEAAALRELGLEEQIEQLRKQVSAAEEQLKITANALHEKRTSAIPGLEKEVNTFLAALEMPEAALEMRLETLPEPGSTGADRATIYFRSAKALPMQPLHKVASGGEISRLTFSLQCAIGNKAGSPLMIFDEADTGVSGQVALSLGKMMKQLALHHQVITITHLPQVASAGNTHFHVTKKNDGDLPGSAITLLNKEARIYEVARMLSGHTPGAAALENAAELLRQA
jgi:DNA repair protein RecN (Recombination protein N)